MQRAVLSKCLLDPACCRIVLNRKLWLHSRIRPLTHLVTERIDGTSRCYSSGQMATASNYTDEMYKAWQRDPASVHAVSEMEFNLMQQMGKVTRYKLMSIIMFYRLGMNSSVEVQALLCLYQVSVEAVLKHFRLQRQLL